MFEKEIISAVYEAAAGRLTKEEIAAALETPKESRLGDLALPCFKFSRSLRKAPPAIAGEIAAAIKLPECVERTELAGGYLNFFFDRVKAAAGLRGLDGWTGESTRGEREGEGKTICLDYSSVNIAKPFHIGHLSTTVIGAALYRIFKYLGYNAVGINHLGDWGTQFGKLIVAVKKWSSLEEVEKNDEYFLNSLYVRYHREAEADPALDDEARAWFRRIEDGDKEALAYFDAFKRVTMKAVGKVYDRLGVTFDSYAGESFYNDKMQPCLDILKNKGLLVDSDGAKVVRLDDYDMPPCLLVKADGATLYATRDIAAAYYRKKEYDFDKCLYVVAYQQNLHFKQLFKVLELMGFDGAGDMEHVAFGMVSLEDGAMSTRGGRVVWLKEVLVFSALWNSRIKDIVFSFDKVLNFDGETSPYVQYTHARCASVLRKAGAPAAEPDLRALSSDEAYETVKAVLSFEDAVRSAARYREPCYVTRYAVDLAEKFNRFYYAERIITEDEAATAAKLALTDAVARTLRAALSLIGIKAPDEM